MIETMTQPIERFGYFPFIRLTLSTAVIGGVERKADGEVLA